MNLKLYTIPRLLIIDEIDFLTIDQTGANLFCKLISHRYEQNRQRQPEWGSFNDLTGKFE